jgi:lysophospholipase L1-like esterase
MNRLTILLANCLIMLALLKGGVVRAEQLVNDAGFVSGPEQATLAAWKIDPLVGGQFSIIEEKQRQSPRVIELKAERVVMADGQQNRLGRLIQTARKPVIPGRKYVLKVEARGEGKLTGGVVEYSDPHSPVRVGEPGRQVELTPEWQTFSFTFTPGDRSMLVAPYFQLESWLGRLQLRQPSLESTVQPGKISIRADDFVFDSGQAVGLKLTAEHADVKLILYGPGGVPPGPGGKYGGSDAWVDHFHRAIGVEAKPGLAIAVKLDIPSDARPGFYRVVAVDKVTGQASEAGFCIYPKATADEFRSLSAQIKVPDGTVLVFVGDSLTDFFRGRNYVDLVARALEQGNPGRVQVINAGVGGTNIELIEKRLEKDVNARKPTHVFIFEGANDTKRPFSPTAGLSREWVVPIEKYEAAYRRVIGRIQSEAKAQVVVMTMAPGDPTILEPTFQRAKAFGDAKNFFCLPEDVAKAAALQKRLAQELGLPLIDTHARFQALLESKEKCESLFVDDGVHLSENGNRETALAVLGFLANNANVMKPIPQAR